MPNWIAMLTSGYLLDRAARFRALASRATEHEHKEYLERRAAEDEREAEALREMGSFASEDLRKGTERTV